MHEQKTDKNVSAHYYSCGVDDSFDSACKICHIEPMGGIHSVHGSVSGNGYDLYCTCIGNFIAD